MTKYLTLSNFGLYRFSVQKVLTLISNISALERLAFFLFHRPLDNTLMNLYSQFEENRKKKILTLQ